MKIEENLGITARGRKAEPRSRRPREAKPKGSQASDEKKRKLKQPTERNESQSCRLRDAKATSGLRTKDRVLTSCHR
jgi:hypothetical protein